MCVCVCIQRERERERERELQMLVRGQKQKEKNLIAYIKTMQSSLDFFFFFFFFFNDVGGNEMQKGVEMFQFLPPLVSSTGTGRGN